MKFTSKTGRPRMKVAVLKPDLVPNLVDVVIGGYVYELQFCVENFPPNTEPTVIDMDPPIEDDDSQQDDLMEEDAWRQGL